ncbi:MAG: amino acid adenylation domain-containing protein [Symploca sp. SIO2D2]|nr:amino acid adenylation domain-containing protein [Symploca sp. SIO2D2]
MNLIQFLQDLSLKGVKLWSDGGRLRTGGSQEVLTTDVIAQLKQYKSEILQLIRENPDIAQVHPLSYGQKGLWFLWQLAPQSHNYNASFAVRIYSKVNITIWQQVFQALRERHPLLRSTFPRLGEQPIQQLHQHQELDFLQIDASSWTEEELHNKVVAAYKYPFNLETEPVMRVRWFTCSEANHIMLVTIHHIATDGRSYNLIAKELPQLYQAKLTGIDASLPPLKHSYQDFVSWQKELVESAEGERLWNYWQQQLAGELPVLNLPTDKLRPPIQNYNGSSYPFKLSEKLTQQLKELAKTEGVTLYMILLAAFQVLLYRYTGQEDILVGSSSSGRTRNEFASIVGYFVDPVVTRVDLAGNPCFKDFLYQVRQAVLGALGHQDYPFVLLVEKLQPERNPSHSPIFQASFILQKFLESENMQKLFLSSEKALVDWGGIEVEPLVLGQYEGLLDLLLEMVEEESYLFGLFKYNADLFDKQTIARMAGHFEILLEGIVTNPQQKVGELPLLSETEKQQLLVGWNNTKIDYPTDKCIHQLFESQVKETPLSVALIFEEQKLTYSELNNKANQLGHYLQNLGVKPEVLVGIFLDRSVEMVISLLAILKAGGAYVPLDPSYPSERISYILADSQVSVLLTVEKLVDKLTQPQAKGQEVICLDTEWGKISQENPRDLVETGVKLDNLAYVIYTSGSTGTPKGVAIEHRSLTNFAQVARAEYQINNQDRVLQFASISFDAAAEEIYPCFISGGALVLRTNQMLNSVSDFLQKSQDWEITIWDLPTAYWQEITRQLKINSLRLPQLLRLVIIGGERALPLTVKSWYEEVGDYPQLINTYGPTEATVVATLCKVTAAIAFQKEVPIGCPLANVQAYILDKHLQPVPIGVPGELHLGGSGLARGYLNRPELTAEKFIPNPFDNSKLYKTGDLARYLPDGNIEFLGRIDHQVKVRGYRIETGEIEATLTQYPSVKETVVLATKDNLGNQRIVAYLVLETETTASSNPEVSETEQIKKLKQYLKERLPEYMIPSGFVLLSQLPLTPNGKIDRKALPVADVASSLSTEYVAPETQKQKALAKIWAEVLGREQVGINDNFFDLGGHSLMATQVVSRIRNILNLELSVSKLFENPTIAQLSTDIEAINNNINLSLAKRLQTTSNNQEKREEIEL